MKNYTVNELLAIASSAEITFKDVLGYDQCTLYSVHVRKESIIFEFQLRDDFQDYLSYAQRIDNGFTDFTPEKLAALSSQTWRNREQRELALLARQVAGVRHDVDKLVSAQAIAFVKSLDPLAAEINGLLERPIPAENPETLF